MFPASRPNFVILDLAMPQMNGRDVCRQLRKESDDIPILVLTGSSDEVSRVTPLEMGADHYVTKPFSPREVLARVRAALRRTRRTAEVEQLYFGDVSVDFAKMEAFRGSRPVPLTPQGSSSSKYFAQHPQRVLSRDQLAEGADDLAGPGDHSGGLARARISRRTGIAKGF